MLWSLFRRPSRAAGSLLAVAALLALGAPAQAAEPTLKLLSAGDGPKKQLRVTPKVGSKETFEMVMSMRMVMDMGGMGQIPQDLPPFVMTMAADITKVEPNGDVHYTFGLTEAGLRAAAGADPAVTAAIEAEVKKLVGTQGTVVVSDRGMTRSSTLTPPAGVPADQFANMQKGLNHASAPFPAEPVGVGARWEVTQNVEDGGLKLSQVTTYTVTSIAADTVVVDTSLVQNAAPQQIGVAGLPPGSSASLVSLDSKATGSTTFDLKHIFPTVATMAHALDTRMKIVDQGQEIAMGMKMNTDLEMARK